MRKSKILPLCNKTFQMYASVFNVSENKDSEHVINKFCAIEGIELFKGGLPKNVAGQTDGKRISVDFKEGKHGFNTFIFFHEYGHLNLHYDKPGMKLTIQSKEMEADGFALIMTDSIYPGNYEELLKFVRSNPRLKTELNK